MIISHKYKYVFVQIPRTGSTAIGQELCEHYDGLPILRKHSNYYEFLREASKEEKKYFVFAGMRNPLDSVVSLYFKLKTDHRGRYTREKVKDIVRGANEYEKKKHEFIKEHNADFQEFFKRFYRWWYTDIIILSKKRCNTIVYYENIQEDFAKALQMIGVDQIRPLPYFNKTAEKNTDFLSYYTPDIIDQAKKVFGPFMQEWDYDFPEQWGRHPVALLDSIGFHALCAGKTVYRKHFKYSASSHAMFLKRMVGRSFS